MARRLVFVNSRRRSSATPAAALPRRPTMLLLLLWLLPATGSSESSPGTISKPHNQSCPETGYFFEKESGLEPAPCYLCFCTEEDAVCSLRPAASCDKQLYTNEKKIIKRVRRTPGLADIFFRDATRQIFNREPTQEECKPNSSKSIGCPPADWCKGCMVCDCDANGHWDCHLMSFCDGNSKRKAKKSKKNEKKKTVNAKPVKKENKKKVSKDDTKKIRKIVKKSVNNPISMPQISVETKKTFKRMDQKSPVVIKRYISTKSPLNSRELMKYKNEPSKLAQKLYKQYMSNMGKSPSKIRRRTITDKHKSGKTVKNKRIFKANPKQNKMKHNKPMNTNKNKHKNNPKVKKGQKREANKKQLKKKSPFKAKKYMTSKFNRQKRSKRDINFVTDYPTNTTNFEGIETAYAYHSVNGTEVPICTKDNITTNLNNYAYTVDDLVASVTNTIGTSNYSQYETTERYLDIITIDDKNLTTEIARTETTVTEKVKVEHTTDRGLKLMNVYNDVLKKTQLMNDDYFQQNETAENAYNLINMSKNLNEDMRRKVYALDKKKIALVKKKCNLKRLIKTLNSRIRFPKSDIFKNKSLVDEKSTRVKIDGTLNDIQKLLEKMLHGATKNKKTKERLKSKSFIAIKYLKKLFTKLFSRRQNRTAVEKVAVLDSICETFGPCRISEKKNKIVNLKVKQLISETFKALKSIKIIKGLLQLLNNKKVNNVSEENDFKVHLKHLNAILKDEYSSKVSWTQTQITQMNHIKANTQFFIKSIGNFAIILNDIISIIQSENKQFKLKQDLIIKNQRIKEKNVIPKIKRLLFKYNLIQNTFLRKMYGALTDIEKTVKNGRTKTASEPVKTETQNKIESENNITYKIAIDKYVDNINENLQKLKQLAASMNSNTRRKRDVRDDDAIEYLLTLMEYLLKRNNPLDTPPVNDGIDLLIEAIRRSPEIRPIQKPTLQYVPVNTVGPANSAVSREEGDSKSKNDNSKEDSKSVHDKSTDESADNGTNGEDRKMNNKDEVTIKSIKDLVDLSDVITEYPSKVYMASYISYDSTEKPDNETEIRKSYDMDPLVYDDNLKFVRKAESALEASNQLRSTTLPIFKEDKEERSKMRQNTPRKENLGVTKEPKTKLDLINEAYEQEIREQREQFTAKPVDFINDAYDQEDKKNKSTVNTVDYINENNVARIKEKNNKTAKPRHRVKGETGLNNLKSLSADISSITKEILDEKEKYTDTEKVSYRKQMDLLNSLDYGTDKSLIDDSDSKDRSPVDRFINDNDLFVAY